MTARVPLNTVRYGRHEMVQFEDEATEDITVGYLVEQTGNGYAAHGTDAGIPQRVLIAYEDRGFGMQLSEDGANDESSYYPAGTNMKALQPSGGAEFTLWLTGGQTVSHGDGLVSAGDGTLRAFDPTPAAEGGPEDPPEAILFEADFKADYYDSLNVTTDAGSPGLIDTVYTG